MFFEIQTINKYESHDTSDLTQIKSELEEIIKKLKT